MNKHDNHSYSDIEMFRKFLNIMYIRSPNACVTIQHFSKEQQIAKLKECKKYKLWCQNGKLWGLVSPSRKNSVTYTDMNGKHVDVDRVEPDIKNYECDPSMYYVPVFNYVNNINIGDKQFYEWVDTMYNAICELSLIEYEQIAKYMIDYTRKLYDNDSDNDSDNETIPNLVIPDSNYELAQNVQYTPVFDNKTMSDLGSANPNHIVYHLPIQHFLSKEQQIAKLNECKKYELWCQTAQKWGLVSELRDNNFTYTDMNGNHVHVCAVEPNEKNYELKRNVRYIPVFDYVTSTHTQSKKYNYSTPLPTDLMTRAKRVTLTDGSEYTKTKLSGFVMHGI